MLMQRTCAVQQSGIYLYVTSPGEKLDILVDDS